MRSGEIIKKLEQAGWIEVRQSGSHKSFRHPEHPLVVTVPHPKREMPIGTLKSIERASGLKLR